jgi:acyl-ACP thioesterase
MQPIYRQEFKIDPTAVDCFDRLKPSRLLLFAQEIAGLHCDQISMTYDQLADQGLFWAVIRNRVQITRLPKSGETIILETWPMPTTRTAYPRSTVAFDEQGNELFRSISLWVLMDRSTRSMIVPGKSGVIVEGTLRGMELDTPRSLLPKPLPQKSCRSVCFGDLDVNGHMNNARYLDWVMDLLPSAFHKNHTLRDMTLCYLNEAREGQLLDTTWDVDGDGVLQVDIHRQKEIQSEDHDRIFAAKLQFEDVVL